MLQAASVSWLKPFSFCPLLSVFERRAPWEIWQLFICIRIYGAPNNIDRKGIALPRCQFCIWKWRFSCVNKHVLSRPTRSLRKSHRSYLFSNNWVFTQSLDQVLRKWTNAFCWGNLFEAMKHSNVFFCANKILQATRANRVNFFQ